MNQRRALGGVGLLLVYVVVLGGGSRSGPAGQEPIKETREWQLSLSFSVVEAGADGGMVVNRLVAGGDPSATEGYDQSQDIRALLRGPLKAYFSHEGELGYDPGGSLLWKDMRKSVLPLEWRVGVEVEAPRPVLVSWELPEGEVSCLTHQFILEDVAGQLPSVDLCLGELLSYESNGEAKQFVLRVL